MADKSGIEWTDATWNPVVGCKPVSEGCDHCYAAREASGRLASHPVYHGLAANGVFNGLVRVLPDRLDQPLRWQRPRRIFVNSMSGLFHRGIDLDFQARIFEVMERATNHTFQVLTKRPEIMKRRLRSIYGNCRVGSHIWIGTTIESGKHRNRADHLREIPASVRFISAEPLLGPIDALNLDGISWVVAGGESGPGARPMHPDWVRGLRDVCQAQDVAFLFKQWGEWAPGSPDREGSFLTGTARTVQEHALIDFEGNVRDRNELSTFNVPGDWTEMTRYGRRQTGRELDGVVWNEYPDGSRSNRLGTAEPGAPRWREEISL